MVTYRDIKDFIKGCKYGLWCSPLTALATIYVHDLLEGQIPLQGLVNAIEFLITGR